MPSKEEIRLKVCEMVSHYRTMEAMHPNGSLLREARWQYADMANGGDGGPLGYTESNDDPGCSGFCHESLRSAYYSGYPDSFFLEVINLLSWPLPDPRDCDDDIPF